MRQLAYTGVRKLPGVGFTTAAFVTGIWAALDAEGFRHWITTRDISATGALIALAVAIYIAALWLTRNWNRTDREHYREQLQTCHVIHVVQIQRLENLKTDAELAEEEKSVTAIIQQTTDWLRTDMGEAAVAKYMSGVQMLGFMTWEGEHADESRKRRSNLIAYFHVRLGNIDELLAADTWDHPTPLHKRERSKRWEQRKARLWKMIGRPRAASMPS